MTDLLRIYLDNEHYVTSWRALEQLMLELAAVLEQIAHAARTWGESKG